MKKTIKWILQIVISLLLVKLCMYCGEITGESWAYGVLWAIMVDIIFHIKIKIEVINEDGTKTTRRIY